MGIFTKCQITLELGTSIQFKKKQEIKKKITENDGIISYIITKKTTHLVVSNPEKADTSYKMRQAIKYDIPVVSMDFIYQCVEKQKLLDPDQYIVYGTSRTGEFSSGKIVDRYEVAKSAVLCSQRKDHENGQTNFCVLEIHIVPIDDINDDKSGDSSYKYRVFTHSGILDEMKNEDCGSKECRYFESSDEALDCYTHLYEQQESKPHNLRKTQKMISRNIGSRKFRKVMLEMQEGWSLSSGVSALVEHVWEEATGQLEDILSVSVESLKTENVEKAEALLLQLKRALDNVLSDSEIMELSKEFYSFIPHKEDFKVINSKSVIAKKQELCQLIRDIVSVSEATDWSTRSDVEAKYKALRCHIEHLENEDDSEYKNIKDLVISSQICDTKIKIENIYAVVRSIEESFFTQNTGNVRLLFHASKPVNFVGILSRGLLLPRVVVDDFGGTRTDPGMLGHGIYFADSSSTSAKYSLPSTKSGCRFMLVNEVALGRCKEFNQYCKNLTAAPDGFDSVHGVRGTKQQSSDFKDDEYVVYNTNQQRIRYLVEFTLPSDTVKSLSSRSVTFGVTDDSSSESSIELNDVHCISDPMSKVKPGLVSTSDSPVPLKSVNVRARIMDLVAQVIVLQAYTNENSVAIEAKYVFPLDTMAAVVGFEAFINGKHIIGEVKEKETAHREYKEAISEGHGAYLMDEETPDVFTVSVGNLPPKASVLIKITYVTELSVDGEKILFFLPGSVAPWTKDTALSQEIQKDVKTVKVDKVGHGSVSVQASIEMPFDIRNLESPTHEINIKRTATKAVVELVKDSVLGDSFQLLIGLAEIHVPRMWVEKHPDKQDSQACMLTFYPEFEADSVADCEVIFLVDLSNSMKSCSLEAQKVIMLCVLNLPDTYRFNIVVFGTAYDELFPSSRLKSKSTLRAAKDFAARCFANMGNTEAWRPLHSFYCLRPSQGVRNVFLISDGHINNQESTIEDVRKNCQHTRVFTFGVSCTANHHILQSMARVGAGAYEYFDSKTKSKWERKVKSQISKAAQPVLTSVNVEWQQFDSNSPIPVQAPSHIVSLFSGSRQVVYGFVPHCTQATLKAEIDDHFVSTMVSTADLNITEGKILHQLTARAIIRDWEDGTLDIDRTEHEVKKTEQKDYIINISKEFSIVTQFTSFVAIEKREKEEDLSPQGPSIEELVAKEDVDILMYVGWEEGKKDKEIKLSGEEQIKQLLDGAKKDETLSNILKAERSYQQAYEVATKELSASHPLRILCDVLIVGLTVDLVCLECDILVVGLTVDLVCLECDVLVVGLTMDLVCLECKLALPKTPLNADRK
uniref:Poly [ADP-ribose] polymerase n=1 Tax=Saccoglossus kowalevskii TaxID=10224 RepID=A0ABM0MFB2_SACKO|nr:PREDICTED: poly [ADP-ribose] polymerase 4-like [Saccoglossus kowalevskii]